MATTEWLDAAERLNELLAKAGLDPLDAEIGQRFAGYLALILRWNSRTNLTAVRGQEGILSRHFVECIACARALPQGLCTLLDFGSGAGLPGIPIALCRPNIAVTLAESQGKKAAFLQEAVRVLMLNARVHFGRAEQLSPGFDCVILRAVDKMAQAVNAAVMLVAPGGWLALMTTQDDLSRLQQVVGDGFSWGEAVALPGGKSRILATGHKHQNPAQETSATTVNLSCL